MRLLAVLTGSDFIEILAFVLRLGRRMLAVKVHEGMYEVLDYEAVLELRDAHGEKAVLRKRERVRFLQNNIIAYQDQAWGDGQIFADYHCTPGVEVDHYREGHRYLILISLRETKNRGDVEEFNIERTIKNGFRKSVEDFQIEIAHPTRRFTIGVVFPQQRPPKKVSLIEQNTARQIALGSEHLRQLADGRYKATWQTDKPRLFESYILHWEW